METNESNGILSSEIKEQIKTEEGFRTIVTMKLLTIENLVATHTTDINELKSWKDKMHGIWWAIIALSVFTAIFGIKLFIK